MSIVAGFVFYIQVLNILEFTELIIKQPPNNVVLIIKPVFTSVLWYISIGMDLILNNCQGKSGLCHYCGQFSVTHNSSDLK